jgi:hypothetical protein
MENFASHKMDRIPLLSLEEVNRIRSSEDIPSIVASRPDREYVGSSNRTQENGITRNGARTLNGNDC